MNLNPCYAQTSSPSSDSETLKNLPAVSQPDVKAENNSTKEKSELSTDALSQTSPGSATIKNPNPRIPIGSKVFPAMRQ
ncbi:MAG: hypothetical protein HC903_28695 [Methylacidiphilales bacterium]|nr:hypothetical protein [Candidatus Methylacidiphilales bacterium]NJR18416.1 hypothetical protein [Calothrix sp. CSU_2_0]